LKTFRAAIGGLAGTYARQVAPANLLDANGAGLGYVDIYDTNGKLIKQLVAGGALNAPWGLALAPAGVYGRIDLTTTP